MAEYIEKQKAIKLLDMCMVAAEKRWKEATNPLAKIEFKADKDTIEAMIEVVASVEAADAQPVSVIKELQEYIKQSILKIAFNNGGIYGEVAEDIADYIDIWVGEFERTENG
jgi:hypothetical protein